MAVESVSAKLAVKMPFFIVVISPMPGAPRVTFFFMIPLFCRPAVPDFPMKAAL
jgi:hypothetical protein